MTGFIITDDWLHERCRDVDGCLVWTLAAAHGCDPQARIGGRANAKTILVRRVLWEQVNGRPFPRKSIARCTCGTPLCVHPGHIVAEPRGKALLGRRLPLQHRAHIAAARRLQSNLSDAAVEAIRASTGKLDEVAREWNVDPTYVSAIRLGKARVNYSNAFVGLMR